MMRRVTRSWMRPVTRRSTRTPGVAPTRAGTLARQWTAALSRSFDVHYPAGGHALTIRGSAPGLSWTQGQPTGARRHVHLHDRGPRGAHRVEAAPRRRDLVARAELPRRARPDRRRVAALHDDEGSVETLIAAFHSTVLGNDRAIYAYLPASYDENTDATYPVVYMHDGQNLWAALPQLAFGAHLERRHRVRHRGGERRLLGGRRRRLGRAAARGHGEDCTGDGDCASGECRTFPEAIVIGVANTAESHLRVHAHHRSATTPEAAAPTSTSRCSCRSSSPPSTGCCARGRTSASTAMAGSSLGGLVTAYAGLKHPRSYGLARGALAVDVVEQRRHRRRRAGDARRARRGRSSCTSTRARALPTTRPTPTCSRRRTRRSATSTGKNFRHVVQPGAAAQRDVLGTALPRRDAALARRALERE